METEGPSHLVGGGVEVEGGAEGEAGGGEGEGVGVVDNCRRHPRNILPATLNAFSL